MKGARTNRMRIVSSARPVLHIRLPAAVAPALSVARSASRNGGMRVGSDGVCWVVARQLEAMPLSTMRSGIAQINSRAPFPAATDRLSRAGPLLLSNATD